MTKGCVEVYELFNSIPRVRESVPSVLIGCVNGLELVSKPGRERTGLG